MGNDPIPYGIGFRPIGVIAQRGTDVRDLANANNKSIDVLAQWVSTLRVEKHQGLFGSELVEEQIAQGFLAGPPEDPGRLERWRFILR
jgi:hypothetical protein